MSKKTKSFRRRLRGAAKGKQRSTSKPRSASPQKMKTPRYVYYFGEGHADGAGKMKPLLGGKGANLAEMTRIGLPVPPGFTITTEVCTYYYANKRIYPKSLYPQVEDGVAFIEGLLGKKFGDQERTLLVSVRS